MRSESLTLPLLPVKSRSVMKKIWWAALSKPWAMIDVVKCTAPLVGVATSFSFICTGKSAARKIPAYRSNIP